MLRTHRAGKGPGSCQGVGIRLKEQKGPRHAPHPLSQKTGDLTWEPSRLSGLEWAGQKPSSPLLLLWSRVWEGTNCLPFLISPASLLCHQGPTHPGGGLEGRGTAWELSRLPVLSGRGNRPSSPLLLLSQGPSHLPLLFSPQPPSYAPKDPHSLERALEGRGTVWELGRLPGPDWAEQSPSTLLLLFLFPESPSHLPLLISLASGAPILSGLHFSFPHSPSMSYRFTLGFLPSPWVSESPTSFRQVP